MGLGLCGRVVCGCCLHDICVGVLSAEDCFARGGYEAAATSCVGRPATEYCATSYSPIHLGCKTVGLMVANGASSSRLIWQSAEPIYANARFNNSTKTHTPCGSVYDEATETTSRAYRPAMRNLSYLSQTEYWAIMNPARLAKVISANSRIGWALRYQPAQDYFWF